MSQRHTPVWPRVRLLLLGAGLLLSGPSCAREQPGLAVRMTGGDPADAPALIRHYGCGSCHVIPGLRSADGQVGPPLTDFAHRAYIAGTVPNTPEQLIAWIRVPQAIEPGTVMPNMGVTPEDARDIAAYLYTVTR